MAKRVFRGGRRSFGRVGTLRLWRGYADICNALKVAGRIGNVGRQVWSMREGQMSEDPAIENRSRPPSRRTAGIILVLALIGLIGWFGWAVGRPGVPPVFLLPVDAKVGDVVLSGTLASDYKICTIGPYENCGPRCSVAEYEILFRATAPQDGLLWQQSFARIVRLDKVGDAPSLESGTVSYGFLRGVCVKKDALQPFKLIVNDVRADGTGTAVMLALQ